MNQKPEAHQLSVYYANARSLRNKLPELEILLCSSEYDLVAFSETWLDDSVPNALLSFGFYTVVRKDRECRIGGGVALLIRRGLVYEQVDVPQCFAGVEALVVDFQFGIAKLRVAVTYRAPNVSADISSLHCTFLDFVYSVNYPVLQLGDFNLVIDWKHLYAPGGGAAAEFAAKVIELSLFQLVESPTRGPNILDLVLVNDPLPVLSCCTNVPFSTSDHESVVLCLAFQREKLPIGSSHNFSKANYTEMNIFLANLDWHSVVVACRDTEEACNTITAIIRDAIDLFVPRFKGPRFVVPLSIRQLRNRRMKLHRQLKCGDESVRHQFQIAKNQYKRAAKSWQYNKEQYILNSGNSNALYKYVKSRRRYCEPIAPLRDSDGIVQLSDADKCDVLAKYYSSMFSQDNLLQYAMPLASVNKLSVIVTDPVDTYRILREMPAKTSMGPDGIPSCVLKNCSVSLALPLSMLYNLSFSSGTVPSVWKHAHIVPIYKKGVRSEPSNYRPVSLVSNIGKGPEELVCKSVLSHCVQNKLLCDEQFGFLPGRSAIGQLIDCFDIVTKALDEDLCVDIVYLDLTKAFDSISIRKLLLKLESLGISGKLLQWLHSYLTVRTQAVKIGDNLSATAPVLSGVPQGTKLGPLLFLLYLEDIVPAIPVSVLIRIFADDIKLLYVFKRNAPPIELQSALISCASLLTDLDLSLQPTKCQVFHLGRDNPHYQYSLNNKVVPSVEFVSDLGVLFDKELKFSHNCTRIARKASTVANMILRVFSSTDSKLLIRAFKTYVRPILEYGCEVANPYLVRDIETLERVQRDYTRRVAQRTRLQYVDYADRIRQLELPYLSERRTDACLKMYYKILNGVTHSCHEILPLDHNPRDLRRHNTRNILIEKSHLQLRKQFFPCRYRNTWNGLTEKVANAPSLASMKCHLDKL